jgi:cyanate permease
MVIVFASMISSTSDSDSSATLQPITASARSETAPPRWLPWAMLALAWWVYAYFGMIGASLSPLLTRVREDLGISYGQAGLLLGAWPLVFMVMAYPAGRLNDRIGLKRTLLIGVTSITLSAVLRSVANTFPMMFLAVALFGIGGPTISTGLPKLVAQWFQGAARTRAAGIYVTGSTAGQAFSLAAINSLVLPITGSWHGVYRLFAVVGLAVLGLWILFGRNGPGTLSPQAVYRATGISAARVLRLWPVWVVVLVGLSSFTVGHGFGNWLPAILESRGFSRSEAGVVASIRAVLQIGGSIAITALASKVGRRKLVVIGLLAIAALALVGISTLSGPALVAVTLIEGFFAGALFPLLMSILMDLPQVGPGGMSTAAGLYYTVGEAGGFLAPSAVGALKDATGTYTSGVLLLAAMALSGMTLAFFVNDSGDERSSLPRR